MATRPILNQNPSASMPRSSVAAQQAKVESPLANQLPPWDLVPEHTLLVRRRPAATKPSPTPAATSVPQNVPEPPQQSKVAPPPPATTTVPPEMSQAPQQSDAAAPLELWPDGTPKVSAADVHDLKAQVGSQPLQQSAMASAPVAATRFCGNCGAGLEEGATFCSECGTRQK